MPDAIHWTPVRRFIEAHDRFLVTSHVNPDGDAIGSELALRAWLEDVGKEAIVVNASPTPPVLRFLDPDGEIAVYPDAVDRAVLDRVDAIIVLDLNTWAQLGALASAIQHSPLPRMVIDHHQGIDDDFAGVIVSDTSAAATGVLVVETIRALGGTIRRAVAEPAYAAIITDTGNFRFSNTDARTLRVAADLVEAGADPHRIYRETFASKSWGAARMIGPVFSTLRSAAGGRLAWICATQEMMRAAGATYDDLDGFVDLVRSVRGVELVLFFKEAPDGGVKVSLRSSGRVDAYAIARHFGGGGHRVAAGVRIDGPLEAAVERVLHVAKQMEGIRDDG